MRTFFEWCVYFFGGRRVLDFLELQVTMFDDTRPSSRPKQAVPRTIPQIASAVKLSEWRVGICLRRLLRRRLVERDGLENWHVKLNR
jgi:hypothetical protein